MASSKSTRVSIANQKCAQNGFFTGTQLDSKKAPHRDMAPWYADITWVLMHIVHHNRLALPEHWMQDTSTLDWPQKSEVLLNRRRCARDGSKVKNDLMRWLISLFLCKPWCQKERGILGSSHVTSSISNHLQQAL